MLVVGFFVVPAATAFLLTDRLAVLLGLAALIGAMGAASGTYVAFRVDTNIAGTVAVMLGVLFALGFTFAPHRGLVAQVVRRFAQTRRFHEMMLAIHLLQHEGTEAEDDEARLDGLHAHLHWKPVEVVDVVSRAERNGLVQREGALLKLTEDGRRQARDVLGFA